MAEKIKKISVNALEKAIKENISNDPITYDWNGLHITIRPRLSLKEMMTCADGAVKSCFASDDGQYLPEIKSFAIDSGILEAYTNLSLPANIESRYEFICGCEELINFIKVKVNQHQLQEMLDAIDEKIKYIASANIDDVTARMNEIYGSLEDIEHQFEGLFGNVNPESLNKMITALSDGKLDEEKLVKVIMSEKEKDSGEK